MAQLKKFTSIAKNEEEVHSFTNPAYDVTSDDPEDLEQKWHTQEEIFKPPPQRCTLFNVAVALFILAAGGLAVVLIIKMSEDNYSVQTTPRPIPLKTSPHTTVSTSQSTTYPEDTTTTSGMKTTTMTSTLSDRQTTRSSTSGPASSASTTITSRTTTTETSHRLTTVTTGSPITTSSSTTTSEATTSTTVAATTERSSSTAPSTTTLLSTTTTKTTSTIPPSTTAKTTSTIPPSTTTKTTSTMQPSTTTITSTTTRKTTITSASTSSQATTTTTPLSSSLTSSRTTAIPLSTTRLATTSQSIIISSLLPQTSTTTVFSSTGLSPATTTTTTTTNQTTLQPQTSTTTATTPTTATTSKASIENTTLIPQTTSTSTAASKPPTTTTQTSTHQPTMTNSTTTTSMTIQSSMTTSRASPPELSSTASPTSTSNTSISTTIVPSTSTLGAVNHTTGDPINSTETGGLTFEASLTVTSITWSDDYQNTTSEAYQELVSNFTHQVEDTIQSSEIGESFSHVSVESVRPGSVVFDFRVVMKTSAYRVNESQALVTPSVIRGVLVTAVQNAKNSGSQLLLSGVDVNNISVVATLTTQPTRSTMPSTEVSNMKTTASTQQPTVAMTTIPHNTTVSPCTDMDYLQNTLLSHCLNVTQMNVVASSNSRDEKCQFVLAAVDCILQKTTADFEVTCSEEHKRSALVGFSDIILSYLAIDPVTCLMTTSTSTPTVNNSTNTTSSTTSHSTTSVTRPLSTSLTATTTAIAPSTTSSTKPTTTVAMTTTPHNTTVSPCTDMNYLQNTLLSHCLNVTQMNEVASSNSRDEKCQFVLAAVDCILQKITADFEVTCSEEHKRSALVGFSDIIQNYLAIDPVTCLMTTSTSTPTVNNSTNTTSSTTSHSTTSVTRPLSTSLTATTTAIAPSTTSSTKPTTTVAMTTTPHNTTVSPCTDMDYLQNTLLSHCLNVTQMNEVASSNSRDEKCQFVLAAVDCILQKITADFEVTCSEEHKRGALVGFSDIIQSFLAIDPVTCLMTTSTSTPTVNNSTNTTSSTTSHSTTSVTRPLSTSLTATTTAIAPSTTSSTKPPTTVAMTTTPHNTTVSPCTDMDYLQNTLLTHCLNVTQMNEVASSNSQDEKCQFVLAAVDCILQKITADFEVTCSEEHKRSALVGFSNIIQSFLAIDPVTCLESG